MGRAPPQTVHAQAHAMQHRHSAAARRTEPRRTSLAKADSALATRRCAVRCASAASRSSASLRAVASRLRSMKP